MLDNSKKPLILQQYLNAQINNGGPATGARLLLNSRLKETFNFIVMDKTYPLSSGIFHQFRYFYKTIKSVNPDVVHIRGVQSEGFWGVLAANLLKKKVVLSVHGLSIDASYGFIKKNLYKYIVEPYALKHADLVYCVCKYATERNYIKKNAKHLYGYIYNVAPSYELANKETIRLKCRNYFKWSDNQIVLTYVGRVTKEKGLAILMKSFSSLLENYNNIVLCICGDGNYLPQIKEKYSTLIESRKLFLLGKVSKVKEILCSSDIFVFPTLHENLSNSLLEAAIVGLSIVATNVGGNPEVVQDKYNGLLVNANNIDDLSISLSKLIENKQLRDIYGKNGQIQISNKFAPELIWNEIEKMYKSIINK